MRRILSSFVCVAALGQTFDVASVKTAVAGGRTSVTGGPGTKDPGRITYTNASMMGLLLRAYDVAPYQVAGPSWLDSEQYDVTATIPEGATKEEFRAMLQNLLAERFHMTMHHETRDLPGYELVVRKRGPKLKETKLVENPADAAAPKPPGPLRKDADGFPIPDTAAMVTNMKSSPNGPMSHMAARAQPMSKLATVLSGQLHAPVADRTGLTAKYDFTLSFSPGSGGPQPAEDALPPLIVAIQEQLGLRLDAKKVPTDVIVVDRLEKTPVAN